MENQTETENRHFHTDDLLLSSYLLCRKAILVDVMVDSSRHYTFIFQDPVKCRQFAHEYINGAAVVAKELFSAREELLGLMRNRNGYGRKYENTNK